MINKSIENQYKYIAIKSTLDHLNWLSLFFYL